MIEDVNSKDIGRIEGDLLAEMLNRLAGSFSNLPAALGNVDYEDVRNVLSVVSDKLKDNYPYQHPLYAGQMLKPPHPVARLAYALAMWINPNNHAIDGGIASSIMEKEAVANLAEMLGWKRHLGHLTGGGTMANLEALWVAGKSHPGKVIVGSEMAHYTHSRISDVLGLPFLTVESDTQGRMRLDMLEKRLVEGNIGTVVVTLGTTGTGSVDPLHKILEMQSRYGFRVHVDAAYGGYFILAGGLDPEIRYAYDCLNEVDSLVIDPHKHGLQPYGCGAILFKDPGVGHYYKHDSPYTYFSSADLHLGEISLECSRAGASAVALWATQQLFPYTRTGDFALGLNRSLQAAKILYERLQSSPNFFTLVKPDLDIVIWTPSGKSISEISERATNIFELAAKENLHLALYKFPVQHLEGEDWVEVVRDRSYVVCLRSCLMKPEHEDWIDSIWGKLQEIAVALEKR